MANRQWMTFFEGLGGGQKKIVGARLLTSNEILVAGSRATRMSTVI
jgi:hypothetical protein